MRQKAPDFVRNQELFGEEYQTRTRDLPRVKLRLEIQRMLSGTFGSCLSRLRFPVLGQFMGQTSETSLFVYPRVF